MYAQEANQEQARAQVRTHTQLGQDMGRLLRSEAQAVRNGLFSPAC